MKHGSISVIIPAAGRGSRLGLPVPKILVELGDNTVVLDRLLMAFREFSNIAIIISPDGLRPLEEHIRRSVRHRHSGKDLQIFVQEQPTGMLDAIFEASRVIECSSHVFVVWGDQALISAESIDLISTHIAHSEVSEFVAVMVTECDSPYVQYVLEGSKLLEIREQREGDACDSRGLSDCGLFALTTKNLLDEWRLFKTLHRTGKVTGELNFLPFIEFLCVERGWGFAPIYAPNPNERIGINTIEDLEYVKSQLKAKKL